MKLAAIRIRGMTGVKHTAAGAMKHLHLNRKFHCVVLPDTPVIRGQIQACKDFITFGGIDDATERLLVEKRAKKGRDGKQLPYYTLNPPRGGFERKGIKLPYNNGGALGDRKDKMGALISRMV